MESLTEKFGLTAQHGTLFTLATALNEQAMRAVFSNLALRRFGPNWSCAGVRLEVLRRRSQRCVIRYIVDLLDHRHAINCDWRLIGKVYKAGVGEGVFQHMQKLWRSGLFGSADSAVSMPEPIAFLPELCLLLQQEIPGEPAKTVLQQNASNAKTIRLLAHVIATLHRAPAVCTEPFAIDDLLQRCHPRYPDLCRACPEVAAKIEFIIENARAFEAQNRHIQFATIHGDFHLGQVHIDHDRAWLLDFDAVCVADPAADLGNLLVFLKSKASRHPEWHDWIAAFLSEYAAMMGPGIASRAPVYEAITHIRRACKCLRLQQAGWQNKMNKMIEQGVACVNQLNTNEVY